MFSKSLAVIVLVATLAVAGPIANPEAEAAPVADPQWGWPHHNTDRDVAPQLKGIFRSICFLGTGADWCI